jgi:uncharacterized membrane protein YvbJ
MRLCAVCNKESADDAKYCSSCGASLSAGKTKKQKWYYNSSSLVVSFLCVGPFMLPLVWTHPKLSKNKKIVYTVIILILSYFIFVVFMKSMKTAFDSYKLVGSM